MSALAKIVAAVVTALIDRLSLWLRLKKADSDASKLEALKAQKEAEKEVKQVEQTLQEIADKEIDMDKTEEEMLERLRSKRSV